jgi:hypothetical protein
VYNTRDLFDHARLFHFQGVDHVTPLSVHAGPACDPCVHARLPTGSTNCICTAFSNIRRSYAVSAHRDAAANRHARTIANAFGDTDHDANPTGANARSSTATRVSKPEHDDHRASDG